jgi:hypothetical protein
MKKISALLVVFLFLSQCNPASAVPLKPLCRIDIDDAHLAMSGVNNTGVISVKVKVRTVCNKDQTNAKIFLEIHKTGFLWPHRVDKFPPVPFDFIPAFTTKEIKEFSVKCKNKRMTTYYGKAWGIAQIDGVVEYARPATSEHVQTLPAELN